MLLSSWCHPLTREFSLFLIEVSFHWLGNRSSYSHQSWGICSWICLADACHIQAWGSTANCWRSSCGCCLAVGTWGVRASHVCAQGMWCVGVCPKGRSHTHPSCNWPNACGRWRGRVNVLRTFVVVRGRCSSALCKTSTVVHCAVDFMSLCCKYSFLVVFLLW